MSCLKSRVERAEKQLGLRTKPRIIRVIRRCDYRDKRLVPKIPEPIEEWLTYQEAWRKFEEEQTGLLRIFMFRVDPFKEYEARNGLPEGILSCHGLKGEVPFAELLKKATKSNQKQPNGEK